MDASLGDCTGNHQSLKVPCLLDEGGALVESHFHETDHSAKLKILLEVLKLLVRGVRQVK